MSGVAWTGVAVAGVTAAYALVSRRLSSTPLSSAIVFVGCGILIGPAVLDIVDQERDTAPIVALLEAALTLVLFTDAMTVRRRDLAAGGFLPGRLLGIGLPLSIGAGWLLAWPLLPGLTVWELALVGAILAPTDAALGRTAISDLGVPALVRHGLNVESGLNDGMVLPFFDLPVTTPIMFNPGGLTCGANPGQPVTSDYRAPFRFTGTLRSVTVDLSGELITDADSEMRMHMARQ